MGQRKQAIGSYEMGDGMRDFTDDDVAAMMEAFGETLDAALITSIHRDLSGWLLRFSNYTEYRYGKEEQKLARSAASHAAKLLGSLRGLGPIGTMALENFAYRNKTGASEVEDVLKRLSTLAEYLDGVVSPEIDAPAWQINCLRYDLEDFGHVVTVSHDTRHTDFVPSPFVRLVDCIWQIEPRLRVYDGRSFEYWPNLSQWISAKLRVPVNFDQLKLVARPRDPRPRERSG